MSQKNKSTYIAKPVDANGNALYTNEENQIWQELITRQIPIVEERACDEYLTGLKLLNLPQDRIPQCHEVTRVLREITGWSLEPVPALIPIDNFFSLLAQRKFPAATFIRRRDEMDYLQEPDIFHEIFGHCPMLTNQACADFAEKYGKLALTASPEDRIMLDRLFWFTVEFGLIKTAKGLRVYGGGILSSKNETIYAIESNTPIRKAFNAIEVLRTPYRLDIIQPIYFVIDDFSVLFDLVKSDLFSLMREAHQLGIFKPIYPV